VDVGQDGGPDARSEEVGFPRVGVVAVDVVAPCCHLPAGGLLDLQQPSDDPSSVAPPVPHVHGALGQTSAIYAPKYADAVTAVPTVSQRWRREALVR